MRIDRCYLGHGCRRGYSSADIKGWFMEENAASAETEEQIIAEAGQTLELRQG